MTQSAKPIQDFMARHPLGLDLLAQRRSVRRFLPLIPGREEIEKVVRCASYAPSAHNAQPWRFVVVNDPSRRSALILRMAERFRQDMEKDRNDQETIQKRLSGSFSLFSEAPVLMVCCADPSVMDHYPDPIRSRAEDLMAVQSVAAAIENLLLGACGLGMAGCWFCAPLFCPDVVVEVLALPPHWHPQALITLGYPAEDPAMPPRRGFHDICLTR
jgi:coenzyme F420-0:L-glutamate ligase/coenzyme F420-1:gamma-L-glutamate ligase